MIEDEYRYDEWVAEAMRSVLRRALTQLSIDGPDGDHHFYVNFKTDHEDVGIPGFLKAQYPQEIVIVLQHQFEQFHVEETGFEVTLSFSGQKHRLYVPFDAVTAFSDPSVNFSLQFGAQILEPGEAQGKDASPQLAPAPDELSAAVAGTITAGEGEAAAESDEPSTAEVINIEAFRKK